VERCGAALIGAGERVTTYACPMHPEVVSHQPGHCGMKLLATGSEGKTTADHDHAGMGQNGMEHAGMDHSGMEHAGMDHGGAGGIEWDDDMSRSNARPPAPPCIGGSPSDSIRRS
jgi:uncharacterized protein involved in copper resistance